MNRRLHIAAITYGMLGCWLICDAVAESPIGSKTPDPMRALQTEAVRNQTASFGRWGNQPGKFSTWTNHSNRLIPVYTFGMSLASWRDQGSPYADPDRLREIYRHVIPSRTLNRDAIYYDQTQVYDLMRTAVDRGKKHIIVFVFDGMDWQTTRAAAIFKNGDDLYDRGRGRGLSFQDYRGVQTDFAFVVTSPAQGGANTDVDAQTVRPSESIDGGFDPARAGPMPWQEPTQSRYPLGLDREVPHAVTDSASSATSLFSGIKTYNGSINVAIDGSPVQPIARDLQSDGFRVGIVSSVPIPHATPASAYANNVSRRDYQDISRDMIGLPSSFHRNNPLPGLDVVLGGGYGEIAREAKAQGTNFMPGNEYLHESDIVRVEDRYVFATRTVGKTGGQVLNEAVEEAIKSDQRLLGLFGVAGGHLPFQTADGNYVPTFDVRGAEEYSKADVMENPTLSEMTSAALRVLSSPHGSRNDADSAMAPFWLLVEAGDVDWANHANNLDNSIGAVLSGAAAFTAASQWVEANDAWEETLVIVTSDHGHFLVLDDVEPIAEAGRENQSP